ncbi:MAG: CRTAC1 family protein [Planctomycetota bacterium]
MIGIALVLLACHREPHEPPRALAFRDVTRAAGITFVHHHGGTGQKLFPETMGAGCAFLDYDGDDDLDIYLVNGPGAPAALYQNDGHGKFQDVTRAAGLGKPCFGMGCCAADVDNDGGLDLFLASYGSKTLYRNAGGGRFADVTAAAGFGDDSRWATSAAFGDYDNDGYVDLYVCHYVKYDIAHPPTCLGAGGVREYCNPADFPSEPDALYRNRGDGTFEDVTTRAGIDDRDGRGLGVVFGDPDDDGDQDVFVANDMSRNDYFENSGHGTFSENGLQAGLAYNEGGHVSAGMGTDFGDYDNDGREDLYVVNFSLETNTLFHNDGGGLFTDRTAELGLAPLTLRPLGFGTLFFDPDLDGDLDLFTANGHVLDTIESYGKGLTYAQTAQLLENLDHGAFRDASRAAGSWFAQAFVGRGAAAGDFDDDGDEDLLIANCNQAPVLLQNDQTTGRSWLTVVLVGTHSNRSAIGARVSFRAGGMLHTDTVRAGNSYLSQSDLRLHFGLGACTKVAGLVVRWPSGAQQVLAEVALPARIVVREP